MRLTAYHKLNMYEKIKTIIAKRKVHYRLDNKCRRGILLRVNLSCKHCPQKRLAFLSKPLSVEPEARLAGERLGRG